MSTDFILGNDGKSETKKAIKSLIKHSESEKGKEHVQAIYLIVNTKVQLTRVKDYTPRIIPLTHKLDKLDHKSILLITKDPSTPYRDALTRKDSPTEDVFNQIYTLTKLKSIARDPKKLYKLFKEFDIIVADNRVHKFLPEILGSQFYVKNKKIPFMVQMAKPDPNAQLTRGKKSHKLKDDRCEPQYVKNQMKAIVRNTSFIPPANGNCLSIKVAYSNWKDEDILANINDVLQYLTDPKYLPVGGLMKSIKNMHSAHIKTSESIGMPIYKEKEPKKEEEDDSDFDF